MLEPEPEGRLRFHRNSLLNNRVLEISQWFLVFNGRNRSGAGSKDLDVGVGA